MFKDLETQAIILLTVLVDGRSAGTPTPLTPQQWGRFASWLSQNGVNPQDLFEINLEDLFTGFSDREIKRQRVEALLDQGPLLAQNTQKWEQNGIWSLTRGDHYYPTKLKEHLGHDSPAVLFGIGDSRLLQNESIAVVGSRNVSSDDLEYSKKLGEWASSEGYAIVSGAARGVDSAAMAGSLNSEGQAIGVVADNLIRSAVKPEYRRSISKSNLVLISMNNPESRFTVGNAMGRNKCIYCLSIAAVIVHLGTSGGTWTGAVENLKKGWVPMFVRESKDSKSGNSILVDRAVRVIGDDFSVLSTMGNHTISTMVTPTSSPKAETQLSLF